jgi:hypothetical protein
VQLALEPKPNAHLVRKGMGNAKGHPYAFASLLALS